MDDNKIAVISASLGEMDNQSKHIEQSIKADYFYLTDKDLPPRHRAMTSRLQAKVPRMFGWQLKPGYEYYMWMDGNMAFNHPDILKYFYDQIQGYDIAVVKHHRRKTIIWETRYLMRALKEQSIYAVNRYDNELLQELYDEIKKDKSYKDDRLYISGMFMYRDCEKVRQAMKDWWYYVSRYCVQDQISFPYAMRNLKVKVLDHDYTQWDYIKMANHKKRDV